MLSEKFKYKIDKYQGDEHADYAPTHFKQIKSLAYYIKFSLHYFSFALTTLLFKNNNPIVKTANCIFFWSKEIYYIPYIAVSAEQCKNYSDKRIGKKQNKTKTSRLLRK